MKLALQQDKEPDVNLTPMIDVVFLLLLFFMVSTSFIRESSLKVDLPETTGSALVRQEQAIDIVINANGQFIINEKILDNPNNEQLAKRLRQVAGDNDDPHIIISADINAIYKNLVIVMDTAQQLGYARLTLATLKTTPDTP